MSGKPKVGLAFNGRRLSENLAIMPHIRDLGNSGVFDGNVRCGRHPHRAAVYCIDAKELIQIQSISTKKGKAA